MHLGLSLCTILKDKKSKYGISLQTSEVFFLLKKILIHFKYPNTGLGKQADSWCKQHNHWPYITFYTAPLGNASFSGESSIWCFYFLPRFKKELFLAASLSLPEPLIGIKFPRVDSNSQTLRSPSSFHHVTFFCCTWHRTSPAHPSLYRQVNYGMLVLDCAVFLYEQFYLA